MKKLSSIKLEEIKKRCDAASPGPWKSYVEGRDHESGSNFIMIGERGNRKDDIELIGAKIEDQDFIANARQDIPLLIEEIECLKKLVGE